ncbi:hypothetical protein [Paenibacillus sp. GCM10027626]|uniref:hypothetical protein n=1 Tax=Paenibacillus sp. GCM10027626 TaxID=3273411 RepID=UPI00362E08D7
MIWSLYSATLGQAIPSAIGHYLSAVTVEIEDAISFRKEAVKKAKKMFDKEEYSSSTLDDIESLIEQSEEYIVNGVTEIIKLEKEFGISRTE